MSESRRQSVSVVGHPGPPLLLGGPSASSASAAAVSAGAVGRRFSRRQSLAGGSHKTEASLRHHAARSGSRADNTYRLGPSTGEEFDAGEVKKVVREVVKGFVDGEAYTYDNCSQMSLSLTDVIRRRLKEMHFWRFRFVCHVVVGEDRQQGIECASRCLWDGQTDSYANVCYRKGNLFAVATVFAVYLE